MLNFLYRQQNLVYGSTYRQKARRFENTWDDEWDQLQIDEDIHFDERDCFERDDDDYGGGDDYI